VSFMSKQMNIAQVSSLLDTLFIAQGDLFFFLPSVDSTNTLAMHLAQQASKVLASTALYPSFSPHYLVMIASLAVVDTISAISGLVATIKWPNDILIRERKVAGILIETSHDSSGQLIAVVGIGVNVNGDISQYTDLESKSLVSQHELLAHATTLQQESGYELSRERFVALLLGHLEQSYLSLQQEAGSIHTPDTLFSTPVARLLHERWRSQLSTLGRTIQVRQGDTLLSGVAEGVNENGELLLRSHSGERISITWGDIG
jgi:BirA family biotin operon repressor/biotin-[acetyl-CoA-carboxylase] ligase